MVYHSVDDTAAMEVSIYESPFPEYVILDLLQQEEGISDAQITGTQTSASGTGIVYEVQYTEQNGNLSVLHTGSFVRNFSGQAWVDTFNHESEEKQWNVNGHLGARR